MAERRLRGIELWSQDSRSVYLPQAGDMFFVSYTRTYMAHSQDLFPELLGNYSAIEISDCFMRTA